jgi:hypothetical protein
MENKKLVYLAAIAAAVINIFIIGTLIYFAVDVFALYSENQFTGRMRSFDIDYWNAVGGAAFIFIPSRVAAALSRKAKLIEIERRAEKGSSDIIEMMEALDRSMKEKNKNWDPPQI